jgi:hypothetical protein
MSRDKEGPRVVEEVILQRLLLVSIGGNAHFADRHKYPPNTPWDPVSIGCLNNYQDSNRNTRV